MKDKAGLFRLYGDFVECAPYGSGHINDTYKLTMDQAGTRVNYILQRLNTSIFTRPFELMENVARVTSHLQQKLSGADASRRALRLVPAADGKACAVDAENRVWRCYLFIERAATYDVLTGPDLAYAASRAFASFQRDLADLPAPRLHEVIPNFHNTPSRLNDLKKAAEADTAGRLGEVGKELDFILAREADCSKLLSLGLPERITHNDTKLNNVMIDDATHEGVCVIDLDTVMPGLVHYDFGDMVRTGTSPAAEDERDLSKVFMRFEMFEALLRGYLSRADFLTAAEREQLPFAGKLITLEIGMRFLTDYLAGDVYFKVHRQGHNLDRCRTQLKLVESIEQQLPRMTKLLTEISK